MDQDAGFWAPRASLVTPIPELDDAADLLARASDALLAGNEADARIALRAADIPAVYAYARRIMGPEAPDIQRRRAVPQAASPASRAERRMPPRPVINELHARDGWRCRFCDCRVVMPAARSRLRAALPGAISWGEDRQHHAAFFALTATLDHVVPHSAGGGSAPDNLVTACWPCNFGRGAYTIQEVGLIDPRSRPPHVGTWDGLARVTILPRLPQRRIATPPPLPATGPRAQPARSTAAIDDPRWQAWCETLARNLPGAAAALPAFVECCATAGFDLRLNKVLVARTTAGGEHIFPLAVQPDGLVQLPWFLGSRKRAYRMFAERLAACIPGTKCRETPKTWTVTWPTKHPVLLTDMAPVLPDLHEALVALRLRLDRPD